MSARDRKERLRDALQRAERAERMARDACAALSRVERERDEARERTKQWQDFCLRHPEILPPEPAREIGGLRARAEAAESREAALREALTKGADWRHAGGCRWNPAQGVACTCGLDSARTLAASPRTTPPEAAPEVSPRFQAAVEEVMRRPGFWEAFTGEDQRTFRERIHGTPEVYGSPAPATPPEATAPLACPQCDAVGDLQRVGPSEFMSGRADVWVCKACGKRHLRPASPPAAEKDEEPGHG